MKKISILCLAFGLLGFCQGAEELKITADNIKADRKNGAVRAEGSVKATLHPLSLLSELVTKSPDGKYEFSDPTEVTTCTNAPGHRHWSIKGGVVYQNGEYIKMNNSILSLWELPVFWLPFWYYPLNTDYGWRIMPGYTSRHGVSLFTKYVYNIAGSMAEGKYGLRGATRLDIREENGVAIGQSIGWQLGDYGTGKIKVYYADDNDYDRYQKRWVSNKYWNYHNWGSTIDRERWGLMLTHRTDIGERDTFRVDVASFSDSYFENDFLKDSVIGVGNRFSVRNNRNEAAWEHLENRFALGLSVSGPIDDFVAGVSRLPEFNFDFVPTSVLGSPFNYESSSKIGYYNRDYGKYGDSKTDSAFKYVPGPWANYNTFRFDSYHRITLPFKVAELVSVVPRAGIRGTYWGESGNLVSLGTMRAGETGNDVWRGIFEAGVTFSARGLRDYEDWTHILEPYLDVLIQEADYSGLENGYRPYIFDHIDGSFDYLDQFAGRSRNLPYSWHGLTPGVRNTLRVKDENGSTRTILDLDVYAAIQFNDTSFMGDNRWQKLVKNPSDPNYGSDSGLVMPGATIAWSPFKNLSLIARGEYDTDMNTLAYADVAFVHKLSDRFSWHVDYNGRDHRIWDYAPMEYNPNLMKKDVFNHARSKFAELGFEYDFCSELAFAPYIIWDADEGDLAEVGSWIDLRTDCLGFRFVLAYENEYERVDRTIEKSDFKCGFFVYLRALGPSMTDF